MSADSPHLRLAMIGVVVLSLFAALFARLWFLQVVRSDDFQVAAQVNAVRTVTEAAPRGRILDRNGVVLVDNRPANVVAVDRTEVDGKEERASLVDRLAVVLDVPADVLRTRLDDQRVDRLLPVPVATNVSDEVMAHLRERQDDFPAVVARRVGVRHYPHGTLAAHVLGYVGEINEEELSERTGTYRPGDRIGKAGIERVYEEDLRGRPGAIRFEVDAVGEPVRVVDERPPVPGDDVVLTIDARAQREAEAALAEGLAAARERTYGDGDATHVADAGAVVVLDAEEGSVVAMASWPTFDPRQLVHRVSPEQAAYLFGDESNAPFTNRATQGLYAPGSTWKLVTASAALRAGLVTPETTIVDRGTYDIPNCSVGCRKQNAGATPYGVVDLRRALTVSSDVYFYDLGARFWEQRRRLGDTAIQDEARRLGVGEPTGVELAAEQDGLLATPASRRALHEERPDAYPEGGWFVGANVNLAIGQGELALTPIQLANAYATFATGTRFAPNVGLRVERAGEGGEEVVRTVRPRTVERVATASEVRRPIMEALRAAVSEPGGTATAAFEGWPHAVIPVAGKTGTAQAGAKQDTALFTAVAPADDPRYVVTVVMEQSGFGSTAAAPVARRVLGALFRVEGRGHLPE